MAAGKWNIIIEQGATFDRLLTWKNKDRTLIDLSGYSAKMQIRDQVGGTVLLELSTTNNLITLGGAAGTIHILVSGPTTEAIQWKGGVYDLLLTAPGGTVIRLLAGNVQVSPGVTQY